MLEFWKNEWKLFLEDMGSIKNVFAKVFGRKQDYLMLQTGSQEPQVAEESQIQQAEPVVASYEPDSVDHKVTAYFGENVEELRKNVSGDKTQHEVLRQ